MLEKWYEVWVDESASRPYLLLVTVDPSDSNRVLVLDPLEEYSVIYSDYDYQEVVSFLREDEYVLVRGRMELD